ncbi:hypothetical protein [Alcanivorax quisquiliarum]|uniref:hypothetical protein n=1 Tax=Alcanivorax quisquiliarum TaxID=2933565 RepID=UPI001FF6175B|nr:hypothetical protein [Alcanivorax quisquiliarum]
MTTPSKLMYVLLLGLLRAVLPWHPVMVDNGRGSRPGFRGRIVLALARRDTLLVPLKFVASPPYKGFTDTAAAHGTFGKVLASSSCEDRLL